MKANQVVFVLLLLAVTATLAGCDWDEKSEIESVLGTPIESVEMVAEFDIYGGIHGDGYWMRIYRVSPEAITAFRMNPKVDSYPQLAGSEGYKVCTWQPTPISNNHSKLAGGALFGGPNERELQKHIDKLDSLVRAKGNFYSFYYKPGAVEFFFLIPEENVLYRIFSRS
ncbi:MAG: hypothetical protein HY961_18865 [Ignavibacteriae bacterium]|nr:hypothetical protein [Ignavibacteriota bacterium]